jgi:SAM-dependent methyltransferase
MNSKIDQPPGLRIDLGCGAVKKEGTLGVDMIALPGVDYVLDFETQPLPFEDKSVEYIFSSHCLEHLNDLPRICMEISRVCRDYAVLELWTPYAWHNEAWVLGHRQFLTEEVYMHFCWQHADVWAPIFNARWVLNEIQFVTREDVLASLGQQALSIDFAIRHLHNIVNEFCAHITVRHSPLTEPPAPPRWTYSVDRDGMRHDLRPR